MILPQGLRRMVPATVSQLITLNKDTTLVSIIAIQEVMRHGRILSSGFGVFTGSAVQAPLLQVFIFIGALFVLVNSRCLGCRAASRSASGSGPAARPGRWWGWRTRRRWRPRPPEETLAAERCDWVLPYGVILTSVPPAPPKGLFFGVFRGSTLKFDT